MSYKRITIHILKPINKMKDEGKIMNFDKIIDAYQLPYNEPYVVPLGEFVTSDKDEQSKIDINRAKYYNDIMRLKKEGTLVNAGELGEDMLSTVWTVLHKLIFDKLLIEGERRTLTLYTKDGLKSFDMYEGVWWLDQFMHEQDNVEAVNRLKDKALKLLKPLKTNADRIRSMSDEELAEFIRDIKVRAAFCKAVKNNDVFEELGSAEWLKQPAE